MNWAGLRGPLLLGAAMIAASWFAGAARPTQKIADAGPRFELERVIPVTFGDWSLDPAVVPVVPAPDVQAKLSRIYNQTLARTYRNVAGDRVMLSVAYGGDQSDAMQVHRPEVCYAAQGFHVFGAVFGHLATPFGDLAVKRLVAVQGPRNEPITYWVVVGDRVTRAGLEQKLAQLRYGLTGRIPDGMLVRVSSVDAEDRRAYEVQARFLVDMLAAVSPEHRVRIAGRFGT